MFFHKYEHMGVQGDDNFNTREIKRNTGTNIEVCLRVFRPNTGDVCPEVQELRDELKEDYTDLIAIIETNLIKADKRESVFPGRCTRHWNRNGRDQECHSREQGSCSSI